jgi:hypothetical protein
VPITPNQAATSARAMRNGRISSPQEGVAEGFGQVLGVMVGCQPVLVRLAAGLDRAKDLTGARNGRAWLGRHVA